VVIEAGDGRDAGEEEEEEEEEEEGLEACLEDADAEW